MFISRSPSDTIALGRSFAAARKVGDVIGLEGDLGAGKTQWVKGLLAGLGSDEEATSPTFTLLHEYRAGRLPVYHFDFYRIQHRDELDALGLNDYLEGDGVTVIEWAGKFGEMLPARSQWIRFAENGPTERAITCQTAP
jgi:tRNA threonylcarbamoyladenosine biosynthesis protein TsaE